MSRSRGSRSPIDLPWLAAKIGSSGGWEDAPLLCVRALTQRQLKAARHRARIEHAAQAEAIRNVNVLEVRSLSTRDCSLWPHTGSFMLNRKLTVTAEEAVPDCTPIFTLAGTFDHHLYRATTGVWCVYG